MKNSSSALILLSTYNGSIHLEEQLNSIISQSFCHWILIARDDGSSDTTIELLKKYSQIDSRIIYIDDTLGNLKVQKSFSALMEYAQKRDEPYLFFCDQDDVWLPNKLSHQLQLLQDMEQQYGADTPILIHSDLKVVDSQLKTIHPSYLQFEKLTRNPEYPINTLLINNYVTGCTVGINRALLMVSAPVPAQAYMHDWWCALCAAAMGKIGFLNETTVLYRQHGRNSIGSNGFYGKLWELLSIRKSIDKRKKNLKACFEQAKCLLTRLDGDSEHYDLVCKFTELVNENSVKRQMNASMLNLRPASRIRRIIFRLFLGFA